MPSFANALPKLNQCNPKRRELRSIEVFKQTRNLHPAKMVCELRREERAIARDFWAADTPADRFAAHRALLAARNAILQIIGWPKPAAMRPGQNPFGTGRAGRMDLALAPADAVEVPLSPPASPPMDYATPPLAPSTP